MTGTRATGSAAYAGLDSRGGNAADALFSIGALAKRLCVPVPTLRTWERRYGFPECVRLPSGHRRYTESEAARVRLVLRAIDEGHRAADVGLLSENALLKLLVPSAPPTLGPDWFDAVTEFDRAGFDATLRREHLRVGTSAFLDATLPELCFGVGEAWSAGQISIAHEHFASEQILAFLAELRRGFSADTPTRSVVLSTLPGELHTIALHAIAVSAARLGWDTILLGRETPLESLVGACCVRTVKMLVVTVSHFSSPGPTRDQLAELRRRLPSDRRLVVGGGGAAALPEIEGVQQPGGLSGLRSLLVAA